MRIFNIISILTLITISASNAVFASGVGAAFNQREKFKNVTVLGNPDEAKTFIKKDGDISNIGSLNDASLTGRGNNALRSSELGEFLQRTELKKMDAINQHKINPDNSLLKESLKIEQNPMVKTGGGSLSASETGTTGFVNKSCVEGADFNVDVGLELVLDAEEKEEIIRKPQTSINLPAGLIPEIFWEKKPENYRTTDNELMRGVKYVLSNTVEAHNAIKKAISQSVGNLSPEFIELPSQNVFIFYPGSNNVIIPMGAEIFRNPAIKYRTSAAELARLAYNQVTVILYYSTFEIRKKFIEKGEYWQVTTAPAEKLVEENECYETARVCTRKGIKKFFGKYDINRPCWSEKISYECTSKPKAGCAHLTKQNCRLVDSECEHRIGNICLRWKRNFTCPITKKERNYSLADSSIYCLGGNCHTPTIEENQDFGNVAYLAAINEAQKDCDKESSGICKKPITAAEKRDILKRKAEEEERARRAKEEEKRLAEEARLKAQQEKVRLAEELRAREERKKFLEKERIRREQEQLRIAEEKRIKRGQALALHKQNELERLRQEKQAWYNNYIANMDAGRNPAHVTQRLWYQFFGITPQEYINNPNYTPNTAISRYGIDIVSPYQFIPRPFQE